MPRRSWARSGGFPPALELAREAALQRALVEMIGAGLVESAHDCSEGGIAVTLSESAFAKGVGARGAESGFTQDLPAGSLFSSARTPAAS